MAGPVAPKEDWEQKGAWLTAILRVCCPLPVSTNGGGWVYAEGVLWVGIRSRDFADCPSRLSAEIIASVHVNIDVAQWKSGGLIIHRFEVRNLSSILRA